MGIDFGQYVEQYIQLMIFSGMYTAIIYTRYHHILISAFVESSASTEPWFCDACKAGVQPTCELCPSLTGIFKETDAGRFVIDHDLILYFFSTFTHGVSQFMVLRVCITMF